MLLCSIKSDYVSLTITIYGLTIKKFTSVGTSPGILHHTAI